MFDSLLEDYWRGYTHEQFAEALYETLLQYLVAFNKVNIDTYREYEKLYFEKILKKIIDRDKEAAKANAGK